MSGPRTELLGLPFDLTGMQSAVDRCIEWCCEANKPRTVITMNASLLCMMRRDLDLRDACKAGDLILADGVPVVWTSCLAGRPLPERVAGVDLMSRLLQEGAKRGLSVYLLGARKEVVGNLAEICQRDYPGLRVAGWRDGYFDDSDHEQIVAEIAERGPDMLFIGMPSPFKETWSERYRDALGVPLIMGVGGTFDVLTGRVRRAPRFLQVVGMEWAWRLAAEPRKMWKRYLTTNTQYIFLAMREIVRLRFGRRGAGK